MRSWITDLASQTELKPRQRLSLAMVVLCVFAAAVSGRAAFGLVFPTAAWLDTFDLVTLFFAALAIFLLYRRELRIATDRSVMLLELREAQNKFATAFHLNPIPSCFTRGKDNVILDVNPAWERASGCSRDEALGRTAADLGVSIVSTGDDERVHASSQYLSRTPVVRFVSRDGTERYFATCFELVRYNNDMCIYEAFFDITERRMAEEALIQANTDLEARVAERTQSLSVANEALTRSLEQLQRTQEELVRAETLASLGALVAGVSHELNTPIGNALTVVSTLKDASAAFRKNFACGAISRSALDRFIGEADEAADLTMRSLARAAELIGSFKQVAIDQASECRRDMLLDEVLYDVLQTLRPGFKQTSVAIEAELGRGLHMDSYPGPIGQVLSNLVQNSLIHGFENGSDTGVIRVRCRALESDWVEITVTDNGRGISEANIARVFDPFFTTRLGQGDSGLGLHIVYQLVTALLGGRIDVASKPHEQTVFTVALPRVAPASL